MRREEGLNDDIKKLSKKQCTEKVKPILREPLRSLLCVEKDVEILHTVAGYSKTLLKKRCCRFAVQINAVRVYLIHDFLQM